MIIGHQKQWQFLRRSLEINRFSHAYLFSGLKSIGKKTFALEFIKFLNCQNPDKEPCNKCNFCQMIDKRIYPDLLIISPSKKDEESSSIQISQIKRIQNFLSFRPYYGNLKSVILDEAEKMTKEAQSCLLKTLEEAKEKNLLILVSDFADLLIPTIRSRCQLIKFFLVSNSEIKNYLLKKGVSEKKAEFLSSISYGKPGRAINFLLEPLKLEKEKNFLSEILKVYESNLAERLQYVKKLVLSREKTKDILEFLQRHLRSVLISGGSPKIKENIRFIENINFLVFSANINPKLALEMLMIEL